MLPLTPAEISAQIPKPGEKATLNAFDLAASIRHKAPVIHFAAGDTR